MTLRMNTTFKVVLALVASSSHFLKMATLIIYRRRSILLSQQETFLIEEIRALERGLEFTHQTEFAVLREMEDVKAKLKLIDRQIKATLEEGPNEDGVYLFGEVGRRRFSVRRIALRFAKDLVRRYYTCCKNEIEMLEAKLTMDEGFGEN